MLLTKSQISKAEDKELAQAAEAIAAEIAKRKDNTKANLLKEMQKMAAKAGVSLESLIGKAPRATRGSAKPGKKKAAKPASKVAAKYANPADSSQTWTGRGRQPLWVGQQLAAGKKLEDLLIAK